MRRLREQRGCAPSLTRSRLRLTCGRRTSNWRLHGRNSFASIIGLRLCPAPVRSNPVAHPRQQPHVCRARSARGGGGRGVLGVLGSDGVRHCGRQGGTACRGCSQRAALAGRVHDDFHDGIHCDGGGCQLEYMQGRDMLVSSFAWQRHSRIQLQRRSNLSARWLEAPNSREGNRQRRGRCRTKLHRSFIVQ